MTVTDLSHFMAIKFELGVWVGLLSVHDLFDGHWSKSVFAVCLRKC
jgi:hypothetical protein